MKELKLFGASGIEPDKLNLRAHTDRNLSFGLTYFIRGQKGAVDLSYLSTLIS